MSRSVRIFLSYRRDDTRHAAGRLADRLAEHFGRVFMDVDTIEPGTDFTDAIARAISECDVFLAVIGPQWLGSIDEHGRRRLDQPDDWIVQEIKVALQRHIRVIPVLADGAAMPHQADLPAEIADLSKRHAVAIRHESFTSDTAGLITAIERTLASNPPNASNPPSNRSDQGQRPVSDRGQRPAVPVQKPREFTAQPGSFDPYTQADPSAPSQPSPPQANWYPVPTPSWNSGQSLGPRNAGPPAAGGHLSAPYGGGYPATPQLGGAASFTHPKRPGAVTAAFWTFILFIVLSAISAVLALTNSAWIQATLAAEASGSGDSTLSLITVAKILTVTIWTAFAALYLLFSWKMHAGRNWARVTLAVLSGLILLSSITGSSSTAVTVNGQQYEAAVIPKWIGAVVSLVGCVLMFSRVANGFFRAHKQLRAEKTRQIREQGSR